MYPPSPPFLLLLLLLFLPFLLLLLLLLLLLFFLLFLYLSHSDMYLAAGEYSKAIGIMGENGWTQRSEMGVVVAAPIN